MSEREPNLYRSAEDIRTYRELVKKKSGLFRRASYVVPDESGKETVIEARRGKSFISSTERDRDPQVVADGVEKYPYTAIINGGEKGRMIYWSKQSGIATRAEEDRKYPPRDPRRELVAGGGILPLSGEPMDLTEVTADDLKRHTSLLKQANRDNKISYRRGGTTRTERKDMKRNK